MKEKKGNTFIGYFYGKALEVFQESETPFRTGVLFEMAAASDIHMFLGKAHNKADNIVTEMSDIQKFSCLAKKTVYTLKWFLKESELEWIALGEWYELDAYSEQETQTAREGQLYVKEKEEADSVWLYGRPAEEDVQKRLEALYTFPEGGQVREEDRSFVGLTNTDVLHDAVILDVGQGLCVVIRDAAGEALAFFDLGMQCTGSRGDSQATPDLDSIQNYLSVANANRKKVSVVVSHWHADHVAAIDYVNAYLDCTDWHAPRNGVPSGPGWYNQITNSGKRGNLHTYSGKFDGTPLENNSNFLCGKVEWSRSKHLHHHGMYAQISLSSSKLFLDGDTTYHFLPNSVREGMGNTNGYGVLQACHHGGNYYYDVDRNYDDIPKPDTSVSGFCVIYSAGRGYGHPEVGAKNDHSLRGWTNCYCTMDDSSITVS